MNNDIELLRKYINDDATIMRDMTALQNEQYHLLEIIEAMEAREEDKKRALMNSANTTDKQNTKYISLLEILNHPKARQRLIELIKDVTKEIWDEKQIAMSKLKEKMK